MGVTVEAYSHLVHVGAHVLDCSAKTHHRTVIPEHVFCCREENHLFAYADTVFAASFRGIPVLGDKTFLTGGCYATTERTEEFEAWSGSCTRYGYWRADLQNQFNPEMDPDGPFYELIWFSDCEGTIGPDAAADLLADFKRHAPDYRPEYDGYRAVFDDFTRACSLATEDGLIYYW
ncbi:hypothetical protein KZ829_41625 [Actinoplanes hulinensis]|uniref:DUF4253 domain-containing protein n=1 Tax=Actinoplanes hulinensis TaxID=1144547 RepID=A0ABS7BH88_9ACTN|nr:hypothetical protein [Actinoplanes hulinensis]MBW6440243.1 hypothetical protein [Actinoplanes hulinensis]